MSTEPPYKKRKRDDNDNDTEETREERRQRRLNKKSAKAAKIRKNEKDNYFGYSNEDNPFNDANLTDVFLWQKKYEKQGLKLKEIKTIQKQRIKDKQQLLKEEILKTKARRLQREKDKEIEEKLHAELRKELELEENAGWKEKEEEFHQINAVKRSQIRLTQNRYNPIDILAVNIMQFPIDSKHFYKITNPITLINGLEILELQTVIQEMNTYISDKLVGINDGQIKYWDLALLFAKHVWECKSESETVNSDDIETMNKIESENLSGQSYEQLTEFEQLCKKMVSGKAEEIDSAYANISIDVNYWTLAHKITGICIAKAFIEREYALFMSDKQSKDSNTEMDKKSIVFQVPQMLLKNECVTEDMIPMMDSSHGLYKNYKQKCIDFDEDWEEIEEMRLKILKQSMAKLLGNKNKNKNKNVSYPKRESVSDTSKEDSMYDREAKREMSEGEHAYNRSEETIPLELKRTYLWHDKYRPRKPKYFNRVKTGYSWNKYNQTHYDPDNPPPKIVQGYKFNIFFPDLIDPTETPKYKLYEKEGSEYAILIFHSGPPYQDIAFKIVNNEWEPSHRRGFRCRFEKGIFSLYFNFKRYRYRR